MKSVKLVCSALFLTMLCLFSTSAFAQADNTGLILEAGVGVPVMLSAGGSASASIDSNGNGSAVSIGGAYKSAGPNISLSIGYKGQKVGVRLNQDIGGQFVTDSAIVDGMKMLDKKASYFIGGTYLMFDQYIAFNSEALLFFSEGAGAMYGAKMDFPAFWVKNDAALAFKLAVGFHYFIMQKFGIGLTMEYALGIAFGSSVSVTDKSGGASVGGSLSHYIQPLITFKYIL